MLKNLLYCLSITVLLYACGGDPDGGEEAKGEKIGLDVPLEVERFPMKKVFWGDTHHHTSISGDAFGGGTRLGPEDSYRLALGKTVNSNLGDPVTLRRPLDFLCITDHAEGFGVFVEIDKGNPVLMTDSIARRWNQLLKGGPEEAKQLAVEIPFALANNKLPEPITNPETAMPLMRDSWQQFTAIAEKYNRPGEFTAFISYEWTSVPTGNNLHRNVIFRDDKDKADQIIPFSALQSEDPEKLWEFLGSYEQKTGGKVLAIPHNGNISGGIMFATETMSGEPLDREYAENRSRWEPLFEIAQIKGASETHPLLSTDDEFADFGILGWDNGNLTLDILETPEQRQYQHVRQALLNGMLLEEQLGANPFSYGLVGASDTHTGIPHHDEDAFWGKHTTNEPSVKERAKEVVKELNGITRYGYGYQSAGYTAVYAEANTRADLWDGMKRKEAYGTSGTRIELRVFGGFDYQEEDLNNLLEAGYAKGVPMGGELNSAGEQSITLMISAIKDPIWANLDRIQVVKGWVENGEPMEKIYDVAWSGDRSPDAAGKLPPVGNTVNLEQASFENTIGDPQLMTVWSDPDFNSDLPAFYYVRVLEIPSPTWVLYDKVKNNLQDLPQEAPLVQQERAWSSPIWYKP